MSSPFAVSIMIGTSENSLMCWHTSKPSCIGSITSSRIMSYLLFVARSIASCPSYAQSTSIPSCSRLNLIPFTMSFSSSTTNTFFAMSILLSIYYTDILFFILLKIPCLIPGIFIISSIL